MKMFFSFGYNRPSFILVAGVAACFFVLTVGFLVAWTLAQAELAQQKVVMQQNQANAAQLAAQLVLAQNQVLALQEQLKQAQSQITAEQIKAQDLQTQLRNREQQALPVTVDFNQSFWRESVYAQIHNRGDRLLNLQITVKRPSATPMRFQKLLNAGQTVELGESDGWQYTPQDKLLLQSTDYADAWVDVPTQF